VFIFIFQITELGLKYVFVLILATSAGMEYRILNRSSIPEFGETHISVIGCERRSVSALIMSRSSFASFPVCVYKFSSHYLNDIIFYRKYFGASSERLTLLYYYWSDIRMCGAVVC